MGGAGVALIVAGLLVFCYFLGGYLQTFLKKPIVEPIGKNAWVGQKRQAGLESWAARNQRLRPRWKVLCILGLIVAAVGGVLVALS